MQVTRFEGADSCIMAFITSAVSFRLGNARRGICRKRSLIHHHVTPCVIRMTATPEAQTTKVSPPPDVRTLERVVCKFGGSSLADADRLREVAKLVKMQMERSTYMPVVVLSAMGSTTNELLQAGKRALYEDIVDISSVRQRAYAACDHLNLNKKRLVDELLLHLDQLLVGIKYIKELSPRTKDYLVSFGERLSVRIFSAHLYHNEGINAQGVDAYDIGFVTNSKFTSAHLMEESYANVKDFFEQNDEQQKLFVVTGFIAKDTKGDVTTLGRGGSDLTAAAIGASIGATEVQVWKDVDGILSTDPRIVKDAMPVPSISFEEAAEMAFFGAKVLHPTAMQPAMRWNIPVRVKNSYNPDHPGTVIVRERKVDAPNPVTAISLKKEVQIVDVVSTRMLGAYGFLAEVFKAFARFGVSVDMIATSEVSISMTLDNKECDEDTREQLEGQLNEIARVSFSERDKSILSLVSNSARGGEVVGRSVSALNHAGIKLLMISQGASKINVSFVVEGSDAQQAVRVLHKEFFGC